MVLDYKDLITIAVAILALFTSIFATYRTVTRQGEQRNFDNMIALRTELRDAKADIVVLHAELREARLELEQSQRDVRALQREITRLIGQLP